MHPIQPPSKQELLEHQAPAGRPRLRGVALALLLAGITGVNALVIHHRYAGGLAEAAVIPVPASADAAGAPAPGGQAAGAAHAKAAPGPVVGHGRMAPAADRAVAYKVVSGVLHRGATVAQALEGAGLSSEQVGGLVAALKGTFDFRHARPGQGFRVKLTPDGRVAFFDYEVSPLDSYCVRRDGDHLVGYARKVPTTTRVVTVHGTLHGSLYQSMDDAGESPALATDLADVLAWDVDFYRDPRPGDTFRIVVQKVFSKGHFLHYGHILAAEYDGAVGHYRLFRYQRPDGAVSYYDAKGKSAQKILLKAPVKVVRITSPFGMRMHPILGYTKMHEGVDYGAPTGTPVMATGEGTVFWAGWAGACGNMVALHNANHYATYYCHLSKILVHRGQHVHQKQIIGRVGMTGRATGPHCHYAVKHYGHFVNPQKLHLPSRRPLPRKLMPDFEAHIEPLIARLDHGAGTRVASAGTGQARP